MGQSRTMGHTGQHEREFCIRGCQRFQQNGLTIVAILIWSTLSVEAFAQHPIESAKRILFLGDSITQDGKYVAHVETEWRLNNPKRAFEVVNCGLSSETVSGLSEAGHAGGKFPRPDLHERLDRVLVQIKPDFVVACYGMNDGIYLPLSEERFAAFRHGIERLRQRVGKLPAPILHLTPAVFDPLPIRSRVAAAEKVTANQPFEKYDDVLDHYSQWLLSKRSDGWLVIDVHGAMHAAINEARKVNGEFTFASDGVHPNPDGHLVMATGLLKGLGTSDEECAKLKEEFADPSSKRSQLFKLIYSRQKLLTDAWLTSTGHKRPMAPGKPLDQAQAEAAQIDKKISQLLQSKSG